MPLLLLAMPPLFPPSARLSVEVAFEPDIIINFNNLRQLDGIVVRPARNDDDK
jgi:hypothetical protein